MEKTRVYNCDSQTESMYSIHHCQLLFVGFQSKKGTFFCCSVMNREERSTIIATMSLFFACMPLWKWREMNMDVVYAQVMEIILMLVYVRLMLWFSRSLCSRSHLEGWIVQFWFVIPIFMHFRFLSVSLVSFLCFSSFWLFSVLLITFFCLFSSIVSFLCNIMNLKYIEDHDFPTLLCCCFWVILPGKTQIL